jgi:hypothetical protein
MLPHGGVPCHRKRSVATDLRFASGCGCKCDDNAAVPLGGSTYNAIGAVVGVGVFWTLATVVCEEGSCILATVHETQRDSRDCPGAEVCKLRPACAFCADVCKLTPPVVAPAKSPTGAWTPKAGSQRVLATRTGKDGLADGEGPTARALGKTTVEVVVVVVVVFASVVEGMAADLTSEPTDVITLAPAPREAKVLVAASDVRVDVERMLVTEGLREAGGSSPSSSAGASAEAAEAGDSDSDSPRGGAGASAAHSPALGGVPGRNTSAVSPMRAAWMTSQRRS